MEDIKTREVSARPPFMPLVYICSPYSGDVEANTERTKQFCRFAYEHGQIPLAPHLMFPQFLSDDNEEERSTARNHGVIRRTMVKQHPISLEVVGTIAKAQRKNIC